MIHQIPRLDIMIAYSCNVACKGCISLSDRRRSGVEPKKNIDSWLDGWRHKISPRVCAIFGGEPCLHPDLPGICRSIRNTWPDTTMRLITNGYLLHNFDANVWFDLAPIEIQISVHRKDHEHKINQNIKNILIQHNSWKITQQGGNRQHRQLSWQHHTGVLIYKSIFKEFIIPYQAVQNKILPWHSDPAKAHSICGAPATPILFKNKLYKCPAVANVMDLIGENSWCNYRAFDTESDLTCFVSHIGQPESCCSQCPEQSQAQIIDHMDPVNVRVKNYN
jgi:hypothetical protein